MRYFYFRPAAMGFSNLSEFTKLAPNLVESQGLYYSFGLNDTLAIRTHYKKGQVSVQQMVQINGPVDDLIKELEKVKSKFDDVTVEVKTDKGDFYEEHTYCEAYLYAHGWRDMTDDEMAELAALKGAEKAHKAKRVEDRVAAAERQLQIAQEQYERALKEKR